MEELETTNPVEGVALPSAEVIPFESGHDEDTVADPDESRAEAMLDEFGNPVDEDEEPNEERFEEIERNGKKATIPAWLKPELMMQADYTRKTQELAEARRTFETEREAVQQMTQAEISAFANLNTISSRIDQLSKVDWNAWHDSNPLAAQKAFTQFQLLKDAHRETLGYLGTLREQRTAMAQQENAKRYGECVAELARDLPDWSPELSAKLLDFGQRQYGFSAEDLQDADDPRAIKVLHAAYQWEQHRARERQAGRHAAAQGVRPAAKVGGAAPKAGLDDRLSAEEWLRRRNNQLRHRA